MNRIAKLAFVASITLNVLLIGVLVGQTPHRFDRGNLREQRMEQAIKDLPEASRARLREKFRQLRSAGEPWFDQIRQHQDEAVRLLGNDPFDEAAYNSQVSKISDMRGEMTQKLSQAVKEAIKDLSPQERQKFATLLRRPPPPNS